MGLVISFKSNQLALSHVLWLILQLIQDILEVIWISKLETLYFSYTIDWYLKMLLFKRVTFVWISKDGYLFIANTLFITSM